MVQASEVHRAGTVLELGAGTGAFTAEIVKNLHPEARFITVEKNLDLAKTVSASFPKVRVVTGCATRLTHHLREQNFQKPNAILSGLPWAAFKLELQTAILREVVEVLAEGGVFSTFAYYGPHWLKAGRTFRRRLNEIFGDVRRTPVVLANFPPAFVYYCRR